MKLGSPPREFTVQIDTGSDILWVTCSSCNNCPQNSGLGVKIPSLTIIIFYIATNYGMVIGQIGVQLFYLKVSYILQIKLNFYDASTSSTARMVPCSDPLCASEIQTTAIQCLPQSGQCSYSFQYGDGSGTMGQYVSDSFHFDAVLGTTVVANSSADIVFG